MPLDPLLTISDTPVDHVDAGFLEAVILARKQDQVTVVSEPPYEGCSHLLIIQNVDPSGELQISIEYYEQGYNISEIAEATGRDWKTVAKYIDMADFNEPLPIPASVDEYNKPCEEALSKKGIIVTDEALFTLSEDKRNEMMEQYRNSPYGGARLYSSVMLKR